MKVSKYEVFIKVVELGNLTDVAKYYNYTQSAISQLIDSFENEIGIKLLHRNRSGTTLTSEGKAIYPYILSIANSIQNLDEQISAYYKLYKGSVRIGAFSSVSCHILPILIHNFMKLYPNIVFDIVLGTYKEIASWVIEGSIDVGFSSSISVKGLDTVATFQDPMQAVIPIGHPYEDEETISIRDLLKEPFIYITEGESELYARMFQDAGIEPDIRYRVKDDYTAMAMVEAKLGVTILPRLITLRNPYRIYCKNVNGNYNRKLLIIVRDKSKMSPATTRFVSYLTNNLTSFSYLNSLSGSFSIDKYNNDD